MFTQRKIDLTFQLGTGAFGETGMNVVKVQGRRVRCSIQRAGGPSMGQATIRVYGMRLPEMAQLMGSFRVVAGQALFNNNHVLVEAGDAGALPSQIFAGLIQQAPIDLGNQPASCLTILANAGMFDAIKPVAPSSYPGTADVATIMQNIAAQMGWAFENSGVKAKLSTPYFPGTLREQARRCAEAAHINWHLDDSANTLAIWPKGGARGGAVPLISPDTGLVGYPTNYNNIGVSCTTLFNPALRVGGQVQVKSSLPYATGRFVVYNIAHELDSETPNGDWLTTFDGVQIG